MKRYVKKPISIEAVQWFTNGDHPEDDSKTITTTEGAKFLSEGKIVRRFNLPNMGGESLCSVCNFEMSSHGWIDTLEAGHRVCPGDWIITGISGEKYPCKPDIFLATYDEESE